MKATILLATSNVSESDLSYGYIIGAIIALVIMGYLLFTLVKPEKF
jgi:K+-transporting ATPase KdpF subunit